MDSSAGRANRLASREHNRVARHHSQSLKEQAWNRREVQRLGREFARIAAKELTRIGGPVRDRKFFPKVKEILRRKVTPRNVAKTVSDIAAASLHLNHPLYASHQVVAPIPIAALVESVTASLNNGVAIWDMSPAGLMIERDLIHRFKKLFGYPEGADGTSVAGGSYANLTGLLAARARLAPRAWATGNARIAILAGEQTHYSVSRAAGILGLGTDSVFKIPVDDGQRTDPAAVPAAFRAARKRGFRKFILIATCGSTSTGSHDDLEALAALARREGAWMHVDAAHGGGLIFSRRHRHLLRGIEHSDSLAFDPHKMLFMPLAASIVLVRDGRALHHAFEQDAPYMYGNRGRAFPDIGQFTIGCSQRVDALKTWLTWKTYGPALWDEVISSVCDVTRAGYEYCLRSKVLVPDHKPSSNILCFSLRHPPASAVAADRLHFRLFKAVNASGDAYISSTILNGRRCVRFVTMNPRTTKADIVRLLKVVEREARKL
jgi:L-2,4-diaminobutyrate decarboxylase